MGKPVAGDVVVIPFPFSDLTQAKRRPALVLADLDGDYLILCMITSRAVSDRYAIILDDEHFESGGLSVASNIRPTRLFTADAVIVAKAAGRLKPEKLSETLGAVRAIFK